MYDIGLKMVVEESVDAVTAQALPDLFYDMNLRFNADAMESVDLAAGSKDSDGLVDINDCCPRECLPLPQKRLVSSARESPLKLQTAGVRQLNEDLADKKIASDPTVFGFEPDYIFYHIWGATSAFHHRHVGISRHPSMQSGVVIPCRRNTFKQVFNVTKHQKANPVKVAGLDLSRYCYNLRHSDREAWPRSNKKEGCICEIRPANDYLLPHCWLVTAGRHNSHCHSPTQKWKFNSGRYWPLS